GDPASGRALSLPIAPPRRLRRLARHSRCRHGTGPPPGREAPELVRAANRGGARAITRAALRLTLGIYRRRLLVRSDLARGGARPRRASLRPARVRAGARRRAVPRPARRGEGARERR